MPDGRYARVYLSVMEDPRFDGVRENPRLFGSWVLLLISAEMAWPVPAYLPPMVPKGAVARLSAGGLIEMLPGSRFRVRGLDGERGKRVERASNAAASRWHRRGDNSSIAAGSASSTARAMPN